MAQFRILLLQEIPFLTQQSRNCPTLHICMNILSLMISNFRTVPFAQYFSRLLQLNILTTEGESKFLQGCRSHLPSCTPDHLNYILTARDKKVQSQDPSMHLISRTRMSLSWWLSNQARKSGRFFLSLSWRILMMVVRLWGCPGHPVSAGTLVDGWSLSYYTKALSNLSILSMLNSSTAILIWSLLCF